MKHRPVTHKTTVEHECVTILMLYVRNRNKLKMYYHSAICVWFFNIISI